VEEDAQLGVVVPVGHPVRAYGIPCPLIHGDCTLASSGPCESPLVQRRLGHFVTPSNSHAPNRRPTPRRRRLTRSDAQNLHSGCHFTTNAQLVFRIPTPPTGRFCPRSSRRPPPTAAIRRHFSPARLDTP